jgi:hypothetical protein
MLSSKFFAAVQRLVQRDIENPFQISREGMIHPSKSASSAAPNAPMTQPSMIHVLPGEDPLRWRVKWNDMQGIGGYEIQSNEDPRQFGRWSGRARIDTSETTIVLGALDQSLWVRVRAITLNGPGPWSDPVPVGAASQALSSAA